MGYGQSALIKAVEILATSPAPVNARLAEAFCSELLPLSPDEMPRNSPHSEEINRKEWERFGSPWTELQDDYKQLYNEITDNGQIIDPQLLRDRLLSLSPRRASALASHIVHIRNRYHNKHPETRLITKAEAKARLAKLWFRLPREQRTEEHMFVFWSQLQSDRPEVLNVRYGRCDPWHEVHSWLSELNRAEK